MTRPSFMKKSFARLSRGSNAIKQVNENFPQYNSARATINSGSIKFYNSNENVSGKRKS